MIYVHAKSKQGFGGFRISEAFWEKSSFDHYSNEKQCSYGLLGDRLHLPVLGFCQLTSEIKVQIVSNKFKLVASGERN